MFKTELEWIKNKDIKKLAETAISMLPDYFFEVGASSTSKYHPAYALGVGGLVRHTKAAVKIAHELIGLEMYRTHYSSDEQDLMLTALMLHDGWKHGPEATAGRYTVAEHPVVCADWVRNTPELNTMLPAGQLEFLVGCIAAHTGEWNTDYRSKKEILPKPKTSAQKFVHQSDLLASRRWLIVDFEDDYYEGPKTEPARPVQDEDISPEDMALSEKIHSIVELCKAIIESNHDARQTVYEVIASLNENNRNPNSIKSMDIADQVMKALEELKIA